jgi:hypothetical protein
MDAALRNLAPSWNPRRVRVAAWSATLAVLVIAALVVIRRVTGAVDRSLAVGPLVVTLLVAATVLVACRVAVDDLARFDKRERTTFAWCGALALWLLCLACAPPSVRHYAWLAWLPIVAIEHVSRSRFLEHDAATLRVAEPSAILPVSPALAADDSDHELVVQELVRVRDANGLEAIRGTLLAEIIAGQRHATLHVGFCPPLDGAPTIEVEIADGPDASVKVTQAFAHGAAFELRLAESAEEACAVAVEFHAAPSAPLPRRG